MIEFHTLEQSDSQFETDRLKFITVKSPNLRGRGDICLFIPKEGITTIKPLPIAIFLHGVYGSSWSWAFQGGLHKTAQQLIDQQKLSPMIIAMPSDGLWGDGSGYLPHHHFDFEKWIYQDVPAALYQTIPQATPSSPLFIAGLSMGGFGALRIGAKYAKHFKGIAAHSAITSLAQMALFVEEPLADYKQDNSIDEDVLQTILSQHIPLPPIRFDCGKEDALIEHNRELHRALEKHHIAHIYQENAGGHEWSYWQKHVTQSLLFFERCL